MRQGGRDTAGKGGHGTARQENLAVPPIFLIWPKDTFLQSEHKTNGHRTMTEGEQRAPRSGMAAADAGPAGSRRPAVACPRRDDGKRL